MSVPHCKSCGWFDNKINQCMLGVPLNGLEEPGEGYCHHHSFNTNPRVCECCGGLVLPWANMWFVNGMMVCPDCNEKYGLCETCEGSRANCNFMIMAQSSGIPPMVQKVAQQGNMQVITQVRNPQLMEQACKGCKCYRNGNCGKDTGDGCLNYRINCIRN